MNKYILYALQYFAELWATWDFCRPFFYDRIYNR